VGLPVTTDARALLRHAAAAIVKSGTGTLEAALEGIPFVIAYRTSAFTYGAAPPPAARAVDRAAQPDRGRGRSSRAVQHDAVPERIAAELLPLLDPQSPRRRTDAGRPRGVRAALGSPGRPSAWPRWSSTCSRAAARRGGPGAARDGGAP
jgi:lipid-A-disaccharide synthase